MKKDKTPYKILMALKDGQFHSGEDLGNQLEITRSAIWKAIKQLEKSGITIQSITGKGYRIEGGINLLTQDLISAQLSDEIKKSCHLDVIEQIDSTNNHLLENRQLIQNNQYYALLAEQQTAGRGRRGRHWISPYGHNIYLSIGFRCNKDPLELSGLSLATSVAIIKTIKSIGITNGLHVKWPNDVMYNDNKLSGVLLDLVSESHSTTLVVIGVGINTFVGTQDALAINQPWISINDITHKAVDRNQLAASLITHLIDMLNEFNAHGFAPFINQWNEYDAYAGKPISLTKDDSVIRGTMQGITEHGELLIKNEQGQTHTYMSGDVSLRKRYD